jgi:deoxyribodipyrimidine photo-lyase
MNKHFAVYSHRNRRYKDPLPMLSSNYVVPNLRKSTKRVILHWFRHGDLRLLDNQPLTHTSEMAKSRDPLSAEVYPVIPIFCFDYKIFGDLNRTPAGSLKCGPRRAKFILESVADLRQQLREQVGSQLLVAHGDPYTVFEGVLTQLENHFNNYEKSFGRKKVNLDVDIVCQAEYATEEREAVIDAAHLLRKFCKDQSKTVTEIWGSTLFSQKKSPFDWMCRGMPNDFRDFTVRMSKRAKAEPMLPVPENLPFPEKFKSDLTTYMPTLSDLGYTDEQIEEAETIHPTCDVIFRGGETAALARVHEYVWEKNLLMNYKHRRRIPILQQRTSKLSPWLAHGCLSPRFLAAEAERACVNKAERHKFNAMITWELLQREYCKFYTVKHGKYIFLREGPVIPKRGDVKRLPNKRVKADFNAWKDGQTGYPLVDASMRELKATGWMSNRSRVNCATFLFADLEHDWTRGADWFESHLIDYDVYCNWVVSRMLISSRQCRFPNFLGLTLFHFVAMDRIGVWQRD